LRILLFAGFCLFVLSGWAFEDRQYEDEENLDSLYEMCESHGFTSMEGPEDPNAPTWEEQRAFVQDFPHCPPYDWGVLMNRALLLAMEGHGVALGFQTLPLTFPEGTLLPNPKYEACDLCANAIRIEGLLKRYEGINCQLPPPAVGLNEFCRDCQQDRP